MITRKRTGAALVATLLAVAVLGGCSSSSKSSSTTTTVPNRGFSISTSEGQATLSLNGNLPPNWPSAFPLPTDATAAGSGSLAGPDRSRLVGVFTVSGDPSDTTSSTRRTAH